MAETGPTRQELERELAALRRRLSELEDSAASFRTITESSADAIFITDREGNYQYVNQATTELLGYSAAELTRMNILDITLMDQAEKNLEDFQRLLRDGRMFEEIDLVKKDGSIVPVDLNAAVLPDGRIYGSCRDINERVRSEERTQMYLDLAGVMFVAVDAEGRVILINQKGCEILGRDQAGIIGRNWFDACVPARTRGEVAEVFRGLMEGRTAELEYFENEVLTADGRERTIAWHNTVLRDEKGAPIGTLSSGEDITERKQAEESLRESEERLQAVFRSTPDYLVLLDREHRIRMTNKFVPGLDLADIIGAPVSDFIPETERIHVLAALDRVVREAVNSNFDTHFAFGEGDRLQISAIAAPVLVAGEVIGSVVSARDVTDRRRLEQEKEQLEEQYLQSQKLEAVGRLAGGVAHDFNNLLTVINSYADFTLAELSQGDPMRDDVQQILEAGKRAAGLTRQLLAFSRRQVMEPRVIDLNEVVGELDKMLRRLIGEDVELRTELAGDLGLVLADPGQVEQVLMNLVVNARDAMPDGGKLTIGTSNTELDEAYTAIHADTAAGPYVMLAVTDTGAGMEAEVRERIFEPFFTTKAKDQGSGLGLATVYGIVRQSGGNVFVYSEPGRGTTFKVYLPRVEAEKTDIPAAPGSVDLRGSETILIVEDDRGVRDLARRILQSSGYKVISAANGGEALLACEQHTGDIHLMLTDVVMPQMSGRELADRLARISPGMKVLFMSGYTDDAIVHHGVLDQGTHFIGKPFAAPKLLRKVRLVLDAS